jgi:hypothetical protein
MGDTNSNDSGVDLKLGSYGIRAWGRDAICIVTLVVVIALGYLILTEGQKRAGEHANQACINRLNIYVATFRTDPNNGGGWNKLWDQMPTDLYACVPRFLLEKPVR